MERRDFYELAEANVRHYMPAEYRDVEFELVEMNKMNDVKMTGLKARMPGWSVKPIVYLDGYYEQYAKSLDGTSAVISLANDMLAAMERVKTNEAAPFMEQSRNLYQSIRDRLEIRLCDAENNKQFLGEYPHTVVGDFAATYAVSLEERKVSGLVTNAFLKELGVPLEWLHADALAAEASRGAALYHMNETMDMLLLGSEPRNLLTSGKVPGDMLEPPVEMYVLTNNRQFFGASVLLQEEVLRRAGEVLGGDYVVLPSSVHEVILVPAAGVGMTPEECRQMVREINDTVVKPEERLSDKVKYYDVADRCLIDYGEYEVRKGLEADKNRKDAKDKTRHVPTAHAPRL